MAKISPVDKEIIFGDDEIIVSKTDLKGRITYANKVFCRVAELDTDDVINVAHNIIRHPDMPRCVFKLLWDQLQEGKEIFAYVKNMSMSGKYYWVLAHVTPSFDGQGNITSYHSNRRSPNRKAVQQIEGIYKTLRDIEVSNPSQKAGLEESYAAMIETIKGTGMSYDEFVWSLGD